MGRQPAIKQFAFAGGEISPRLSGRTDLERYRQSMQTCRNFIVEQTGCCTNRPGTKWIAETKDSTKASRLIPFRARTGEAYALEFGDLYVRIFSLHAQVKYRDEESGVHTGGTHATIMTDDNADWEVGQWVGATISNATDGSSGTVSASTRNTITATLTGGTGDEWNADDLYTVSHGGSPPVYEVPSPFLEADIPLIDYAQQNDVMFLTHPNYPPQVLRRYFDDRWDLSAFSTAKQVNPPGSVAWTSENSEGASTPDTHPPRKWEWVVTSVDANSQESIASAILTGTKGAGDEAIIYPDREPNVLQWAAPTSGNAAVSYNVYRGKNGVHGFIGTTEELEFTDDAFAPDYSDGPPENRDPSTETITVKGPGDEVEIEFASGNITAEGGNKDAVKTAASESATGRYLMQFLVHLEPGGKVDWKVESSTTGAWAGEEIEQATGSHEHPSWGPFQPPVEHSVGISAVIAGMGANSEFRVECTYYRDGWGFGTYIDPTTVEWTEWELTESTILSYPASVALHEQRLVFGNYRHNAQLLRLGRTGDFFNFDQSTPLKDDDSFDLILASAGLDSILQIVPMQALVMLTTGSEWTGAGVEGGPLTPSSFDLKPKTKYGSNDRVKALAIGGAVLYVTDRARRLREFLPDPYGTQDRNRDLSIMAEHLFRDHTAIEMQYADVPYQVLWVVRSDGLLLGLTYVAEQNIYAWHRHDTGGLQTDGIPRDKFESVCCVPESNETSTYVIVNRQIDGATVRNVEVFANRRFTESEDAILLDSALTFDGRNTGATTLRVTTYQGFHDGGDDEVDLLTDSSRSWVTDEWVGKTLTNTTTGATGTVTANDETTITATMTGGAPDDLWDDGNGYSITPVVWDAGEKLSLVASVSEFADPADVGIEFEVRTQVISTERDSNGDYLVTDYACRVLVNDYVSDTLLEVIPQTAVPTQLQSVNTTDWGRAHNTFSGLDHLEGEDIGVLVDGNTHQEVTVSSGAITLDSGVYAERLQAGLPFRSRLIVMPLDVKEDEGAIRTAKKAAMGVGIEVDEYRGMWVGHELASLREAQERNVEDGYETISPENKLVWVRPASKWSRSVNVVIEQRDPLPLSVLSIITGLKAGGNQ